MAQRIQMGTPTQRITAAVFAGLMGVVAIVRFFYPTDLVINTLQFFATGTFFGALVVLLVGPKKRM